jgi:hypothetical protein
VTVSLNTINELIFIMEIQCVLCEVGDEFLYIIYWTSCFKGLDIYIGARTH